MRSLTDDVRDQLAALQTAAANCRGWVSADDPRRRASEDLARLLADLYTDGVPTDALAAACGVTPAAVRQRLQRHGYRPGGSQRYTGAPARPVRRCRYGHIVGNFATTCAACVNASQRDPGQVIT